MTYSPAPDRRTASRFNLELPILLQLPDGHWITSMTRNVSSRGVLMMCAESIEPATDIEFVMQLPQNLTMTADLRVSCKGTVVRAFRDEQMKQVCIAATIRNFEFVTSAGATS